MLPLPGTRGVGSSSQSTSAPILPKEGPTLRQACLSHQNKHLLRANVLQALQASLSQIPGWGRTGESLLPELPCTSSAPASPTSEGTWAAQPSPDLRPESPGATGPAPSCSPAMGTMQFETLGNVCFPEEKKNIYIAALLCLLLAKGMFGTCDIMKLQSTAKCLSPSSKLKGKAGWLQPASGRAPQHPDRPTVLPPHRPAGLGTMQPGP